jgi:hypothetical protein
LASGGPGVFLKVPSQLKSFTEVTEGSKILSQRRACVTPIALSLRQQRYLSIDKGSFCLMVPNSVLTLLSLEVQEEKEHLFIVSLLPFFCSCFTESTTKTESTRLSLLREARKDWVFFN